MTTGGKCTLIVKTQRAQRESRCPRKSAPSELSEAPLPGVSPGCQQQVDLGFPGPAPSLPICRAGTRSGGAVLWEVRPWGSDRSLGVGVFMVPNSGQTVRATGQPGVSGPSVKLHWPAAKHKALRDTRALLGKVARPRMQGQHSRAPVLPQNRLSHMKQQIRNFLFYFYCEICTGEGRLVWKSSLPF